MLICALIPFLSCAFTVVSRFLKKILEAGTGLYKCHILLMLEVKSIVNMTGRRFSCAGSFLIEECVSEM